MFVDSKIRKIGGVYPLGNETITDPVDARRAPACARGVASRRRLERRPREQPCVEENTWIADATVLY